MTISQVFLEDVSVVNAKLPSEICIQMPANSNN